MNPRWIECSYDIKLRTLHKLVHDKRISDADLDRIMTVLDYDIRMLWVYDPGKGPATIMLLDRS